MGFRYIGNTNFLGHSANIASGAVGDLIAGNGKKPMQKRSVRVIRRPPFVEREQDILQDVFCIFRLQKRSPLPNGLPQKRCDLAQQLGISCSIAGLCLLHQLA